MADPCRSAALDIEEPNLRRLYDYWLSRKGAHRFPARHDVDPLDFTYVLGSVMLLDVLRDPLRFRVRLHGTEMVSRAGYDLTGKLLDELPITDYRTYVIDRCRQLVTTGTPAVVRHDRIIDGRHRRYEALWLPFSGNGSDVSILLCALIYRDRRW
jgi:hypothetical protein